MPNVISMRHTKWRRVLLFGTVQILIVFCGVYVLTSRASSVIVHSSCDNTTCPAFQYHSTFCVYVGFPHISLCLITTKTSSACISIIIATRYLIFDIISVTVLYRHCIAKLSFTLHPRIAYTCTASQPRATLKCHTLLYAAGAPAP